jgi:hypothetical protein
MFFSLNSSPLPPSLGKRRGESWFEALKVPFSFYEKGI